MESVLHRELEPEDRAERSLYTYHGRPITPSPVAVGSAVYASWEVAGPR